MAMLVTPFKCLPPTAKHLILIVLPHILLTIVSLTATVGIRKIFKLTIKYPAVILLPLFTPFTFGPASSNPGCKPSGQIRIHYGLTGLNLFILGAEILLLTFIDVAPNWKCKIYQPTALATLGLTAFFTMTVILTDLKSCCSKKCKPNRKTRDIVSMLGHPQLTVQRQSVTVKFIKSQQQVIITFARPKHESDGAHELEKARQRLT